MCCQDIFASASGKLTALSTKGQASEGQPIQAQQNFSLYSVSPALAYQLEGTINQTPTSLVLDTGAVVTLLRHDHRNQVGTNELNPWAGANLISANGSPITVYGTVNVVLRLADIDFSTQMVVVDGLTAKAILGLDFLEVHESNVNIKKKLLMLPKHNISLSLEKANTNNSTEPSTAMVRIQHTQQHTQHILAQSEVEVMAEIDDFIISGGNWIIEPDSQRPFPVMVARSVVTPKQGRFPVRILNLGDDNIDLHQGTRLAKAEQLGWDDVSIRQ